MLNDKSPKPKIGNAELADKLAAFNYAKLQGDSFDEYLNLTIGKLTNEKSRLESQKNPRVGGLQANDLYDYEGYRCAAIKEQLYDGVENSPTIVVGITLKSVEPEMNTRITAGRAKLLNEQLPNFSMGYPGIYYLLKKVAPVNSGDNSSSKPAKNTQNA